MREFCYAFDAVLCEQGEATFSSWCCSAWRQLTALNLMVSETVQLCETVNQPNLNWLLLFQPKLLCRTEKEGACVTFVVVVRDARCLHVVAGVFTVQNSCSCVVRSVCKCWWCALLPIEQLPHMQANMRVVLELYVWCMMFGSGKHSLCKVHCQAGRIFNQSQL